MTVLVGLYILGGEVLLSQPPFIHSLNDLSPMFRINLHFEILLETSLLYLYIYW